MRGFFPRRRGGLRRRLLVWGLTLLGAALIVNTIAGSFYTRRLIRRQAADLQKEVSSRVALEIEDFIRRKVDRLADLAAAATLYDLGGREQRLLLLLLLKNDRAFTEAAILDREGREVLKISERRVYLPNELADQSDAAKFKTAMRGENYISPVYTSDKAEPYVTIAVPLKITPQEVVGVVAAEANLKFLWEIIGEITFGSAGYAYLVDGRGNLIAYRDPSPVLKRTNLAHLHAVREFLRNPAGIDATPGSTGEGIQGRLVLSTFAPVRGLGWAVVVEEPVDVALADVRKVERYAVVLLGAGLLLGALMIVWGSNRITAPILELHRGAEIIGQGDLSHRVEVRTGDEIEGLAEGFNKMAAELQSSYATLEQKVQQRTNELAALYDVTATVNQSMDVDTVLQEVIKEVSEVFQFDATRIFLLDAQTDELKLRASFEVEPKFWAKVRSFKRGQGIVGRVAVSGESMIFEDVLTDPQYQALTHSRATGTAGFSFFAVFPIRTPSKIAGTIVCIGQKPRKLRPEEERLLASMADQIGVAVENATLFEETVARAKELSILYDVTAAVNQSLELQAVLNEVCDKVLEVTFFDAARVYLLDPGGVELTLKAHRGISEEMAAETATDRIGEGINGRVAESGEPLIFGDIQTDPKYAELAKGRAAQRAGFRASLCLPLKTREKTTGVINFLGRNPHEFTPRDIALFSAIANEIAVGMENARLFEESVKRAQQLAALYAVTSTVNQSLDLDQVLQGVIERIREVFQFDTARIFLFTPDGNEMHLQASFPADREDVPRIRVFKRGQGIIGRVAETGEPMVFEDIQNDPRYWELSATKNQQTTGFRFFSAFPIRTKFVSVGTLVCSGRMPRHLSQDEIQLISSMTNQIGVAVENTRLFYEAKQKTLELEKANRELIEANRVKADFLAAMSHELRTPLNVIIGNADLIRDGTFGAVTPKQKSSLDKILHYSETLLKLINDVLTVTKVEARKVSLSVSTFRVEEVIEHAKSFVEQLNRDGRLEVVWSIEPDLPAITTDALKLEEILQNLIGNAFKFTERGSIEVKVRDLKTKKRLRFSVADTGIGIPAEELDRIFEQFHQLKEAHTGTYSGVGLGLNIVKRYLEMMQGEIRVESEPGRGSTFTFELPYSIADRVQPLDAGIPQSASPES